MIYRWGESCLIRGISLVWLWSLVKLRLLSLLRFRKTRSFIPPDQYEEYSRSMLQLFCLRKDSDIMEWENTCQILFGVCIKMSEDLLRSERQMQIQSASKEQSLAEWEKLVSELKFQLASQEDESRQEISKLQAENNWLQNRLAEKLQQARHQNDVIDELKRDLVESVQQMEVSEGRRLCYEHKIKMLEEQIDRFLVKEEV